MHERHSTCLCLVVGVQPAAEASGVFSEGPAAQHDPRARGLCDREAAAQLLLG